MTHFIDLRKKVEPQVKIVREIVIEKQPWYLELLKVMAVIGIVSTVVWGITRADSDLNATSTDNNASSTVDSLSTDPVGIFGTVGSIDGNTLSLIDAQGSDYTGQTSFNVDLSNVQTIETDDYAPLTLSDIQVGDTIIAHGMLNGDIISADSLTLFGLATTTATTTASLDATSSEILASTTLDVATTTATTTDDTDQTTVTSSTTPDVATTSDSIATMTDATNTPETIASTTDPIISTPSTTPDVVTTTTEDVSAPPPAPETASDTASTTENNI